MRGHDKQPPASMQICKMSQFDAELRWSRIVSVSFEIVDSFASRTRPVLVELVKIHSHHLRQRRETIGIARDQTLVSRANLFTINTRRARAGPLGPRNYSQPHVSHTGNRESTAPWHRRPVNFLPRTRFDFGLSIHRNRT